MTLRRAIAAVWMLALAACDPGRLDNPDQFKACTIDVETDIFVPTCGLSGCHSADAPQGGLDLVTAGVAMRIATGKGDAACAMQPFTSLIVDKIEHAQPSCGSQMPVGAPLEAAQVKCIVDYINALSTDGGS